MRAREKASCAGARVAIVTAFRLQNWASRTCRTTMELVRLFARAVLNDQTTSDEKLEATSMLEDAARRMRFICGTSHPETRGFEIEAKQAREIVSKL